MVTASQDLAHGLGLPANNSGRFLSQLDLLVYLNLKYSGESDSDRLTQEQLTNIYNERNNAFTALLGHAPTTSDWNHFRNYIPFHGGSNYNTNSNNSALTVYENLTPNTSLLNRTTVINALPNNRRSFLNRLRITGAGSNSNGNLPTRRQLFFGNNSNTATSPPTKKSLINMINDAEKKWKQSVTRQNAQGRTIPYAWRSKNFPNKTLKNQVIKELNTKKPLNVHMWLQRHLDMYDVTFPLIKDTSGPEILQSYWAPNSWINPPQTTNINKQARKDLLAFIRLANKVQRPLNRTRVLTLKNEGKTPQQMINAVKKTKKQTKMLARAHGRTVPTAPTTERYQIVNLKRKPNSKKTIPKNLMKELEKNVKASAYLWNGKPALNMPMYVKKGRGQNYGGVTRNLYSDVRDKLLKNGAIKKTQTGKYYFLTNAKYASVLGALSGKVLRGKEPSVTMWPLGLDPSLFVEPFGLDSLSPARLMGLLKAVHPDVWEHLDALNKDSNQQKVVANLNKQLTRLVNTDPGLKLLLKKLKTKSKNFNKMNYGNKNYIKTLAYIKALQKAIASRIKIETNLPPTKKRQLTVNKYKKINQLLKNIIVAKRDIQGNNINKNLFGMSNAAWNKTMGKLDTTNLNQDNRRKLAAQIRIARYFLFTKNMNARMKFYQSLPPNIQIRDPIQGGSTLAQNRRNASATLNKAIKLSNNLGKIKPLTANDVINSIKYNKKWNYSSGLSKYNSDPAAVNRYGAAFKKAIKDIGNKPNGPDMLAHLLKHATGRTWVDPSKKLYVTLKTTVREANDESVYICEAQSCFEILAINVPEELNSAGAVKFFTTILTSMAKNKNVNYTKA